MTTDKTNQPTAQLTVSPSVIDAVAKHASSSPEKEVGGFLMGRAYEDGGLIKVDILASIEAEYAKEGLARLTFTHETWNRFHERRQQEYPGLTVLGWYHTHPGFGVFMSDKDVFIHTYFFDHSNAVALVVDPLLPREEGWGFYVWDQGVLTRYTQSVTFPNDPSVSSKINRIDLCAADLTQGDGCSESRLDRTCKEELILHVKGSIVDKRA